MTEVGFERRGSIGVAKLERPDYINALSVSMIRALDAQLRVWSEDNDVAAIFLHGEGAKGFCAGGDVRSVWQFLERLDDSHGDELFAAEYRLVHFLHYCPKPVVVWGHGVVMGAGLGLLLSASQSVVAVGTVLAMPEVSIGLCPDVGTSYIFPRLPNRLGVFLALTGIQFSAADAFFLGLASCCIEDERREEVLDALAAGITPGSGSRRIDRILASFQAPAGESLLSSHVDKIRKLLINKDFSSSHRNILNLADDPDPWLASAGGQCREASPTSVRIAYEIFRRGETLSLGDCLRQELTVVCQCMRRHDFREGVRARLVDKDHAPRWNPSRLEEVCEDLVETYFQPSWIGGHPLRDLEKDIRSKIRADLYP